MKQGEQSSQHDGFVLDDYFNELLGDAEPVADDSTPLTGQERKPELKLELESESQLRHESAKSDPEPSKVNEKETTRKATKETATNSATLRVKLPLNEAANLARKPVDPAKSPEPTKSPESAKPKIQAKTEDTAKAKLAVESDSYAAHKERLQKMLQQLTPLGQTDIRSNIGNNTGTQLKAKQSSATQLTADTEQQPNSELKTETHTEAATETAAFVEAQPLASHWLDNNRPHWAQGPFDILLVTVNGLKLALPLMALGHIEQMQGELTPLFGQSDWFMGYQNTTLGNIKTVDTERFLMPDNANKRDQAHEYGFLVSINGLNWGLAVDTIEQPILIDPEDLRWRAKRTKNPWMAATVKDHMCVLLDIPVLGEMLETRDKKSAG